MLYFVGYAGTPAVAQYDVPAEGQYDLPTEDRYAPPQPSTVPLPEDQNGGGDTGDDDGTTTPVDDGNDDGGNRDDGDLEAMLADRAPREAAGGLPRLLDGFLVDAAAFFAATSLIATLLFFVERSEDHPGS